jgi:hypothetical protein
MVFLWAAYKTAAQVLKGVTAMKIAGIIIGLILSITQYQYAGTFDITFYCSECNTPAGSTQTSTGRFVPGYSVATGEFEPGTILIIDGKEYRVDDCGCMPGVIDMLVDGSNGCNCDEYGRYKAKVYVK